MSPVVSGVIRGLDLYTAHLAEIPRAATNTYLDPGLQSIVGVSRVCVESDKHHVVRALLGVNRITEKRYTKSLLDVYQYQILPTCNISR